MNSIIKNFPFILALLILPNITYAHSYGDYVMVVLLITLMIGVVVWFFIFIKSCYMLNIASISQGKNIILRIVFSFNVLLASWVCYLFTIIPFSFINFAISQSLSYFLGPAILILTCIPISRFLYNKTIHSNQPLALNGKICIGLFFLLLLNFLGLIIRFLIY